MNTFGTLLKREFWENKTGFFWVPLVITGITLFTAILGLIIVSNGNIETVRYGSHDLSSLFKLYDVSVDNDIKAFATQSALYSAVYSYYMVLGIVGFFYCLGSLYDDRKDKSILFWKSMPVSDAQTVLSKVVSVAIIAPFIYWLVIVATNLSMLIIATIFAWVSDVNAWTTLWANSGFIKVSLYQLAAIYMAMLWAIPFIGYLLLVSSWTKKVPFLVATVPPVLVIIAEGMIFKTGHVISFLGEKIFGVVQALIAPFNSLAKEFSQKRAEVEDDLSFIADELEFMNFGQQLSDAGFWIGVILGAAMIGAAIYIRRFRDEAF
ncbi:hypothetical protein [Kangiella sediminilitoris]|uniref:Uncharacterized protein n=1 Tax=Kangiella sediminilitoris TaxID=1144748 RepID=A0A1B3B920_9GAMM|nr:hypothetical protein [Kangiella sediminilitoris]AOE49294.1 hypothetical protein KS2013_570 [Kangiella sediminilitoris]